jgi:pSer/pThr/pTyr-binding forkhead associated (FHA) protein
MGNPHGKLVLLNQDGPDREFELSKSSISIGRAETNDIRLDDGRVSRVHARLTLSEGETILMDLGSSNGTRVDGERIERATLIPGATIHVGGCQLKYSIDAPTEELGLTIIDSELQLEQTVVGEFLPTVINETGSPRLVVHTADKTWSVPLEDQDRTTIGRDEENAIYLDAANVSRQHAEIQRRGEAFLLKDLGSANGTWMGQERVDQHALQEGDTFRIGPAEIVFKPGFTEENLTTIDDPKAMPSGRRTVIFVPGLMGSELWLGNERVWPNVKTIITNPELFIYGSGPDLEARALVDEVVVVPNLIKQDQYNRIGDYLVDELAYRRKEDYFEFAYDWRQDIRISARQLGELIETIPRSQPIVIVGHSLGTYVTRYYVEALGADPRVERLILMGGPYKGAVKGLVSLLVAPAVLPFGIMGDRLRQVMVSFPSSFQILPEYAVGTDQHGKPVNFLQEDFWLEPEHRPMLKFARDLRREWKQAPDIPTISIFGYGIRTIANVTIERDDAGALKDVRYDQSDAGDGSVLEESAILPGSEIHPVHQHHGALFVDNDVKMRLKLELMRPYA